jgi:hypothetical protein
MKYGGVGKFGFPEEKFYGTGKKIIPETNPNPPARS